MTIGALGIPIVSPDPVYALVGSNDPRQIRPYLDGVTGPHGDQARARLRAHPGFASVDGKQIAFCRRAYGAFDERLAAAWWIKYANEHSVEAADKALDAYLAADFIQTDEVLWLFGIRPAAEFRIDDDTRLVPIAAAPDSVDRAKYELHAGLLSHEVALPTAAFVSRVAVPKLADPAHNPWASYKLELYARLTNCLPGLFAQPAMQTDYPLAEAPPGIFGARGSVSAIGDLWPRRVLDIGAFDAGLLERLLDGLLGLPKQRRDRVERSLTRLGIAKARFDAQEKALDLGIALEMVLLNAENKGEEITSQLSNHFRTRGAWLLGDTSERRQSLHRTLGAIYNNRSKVAHNGFSEELLKAQAKGDAVVPPDHFTIAEEIIRSIILDGPPTWSSLVMGGPRRETGE